MRTAILLTILLAIGFGIEAKYWIDRATSAEHVNRRVASLERQAEYLEGVFVACLNNGAFFVQQAVYTCTTRKATLTKRDLGLENTNAKM